MNLLKALVLYVDQGFPPEAKNIGQVYKLLTMSSEKELNSLFDLLPVSHPAKVPYCIYKQASDTVRSGVIIGLGARLQVFQNKLIRQITSYDEIDLRCRASRNVRISVSPQTRTAPLISSPPCL